MPDEDTNPTPSPTQPAPAVGTSPADATRTLCENGGVDYRPRPLLQTILQVAIDSTGASSGWLAAAVDDDLAIVAVVAADLTLVDRILWQRGGTDPGTAGFVMQSGQPVALQPATSGTGDSWAERLLGRQPASLVCVPCHDDEQPVGALELVDKVGGAPFSFDDVELASVLAQIAGAAIAEGAGAAGRVPTPAELSNDLGRLATADPARYAAVAQAVSALVTQA